VPIHDQSYRRYGGAREAPGRAWLVIARRGIQNMIARRMFLGLMLFAWIPFVVRAVQFYVAANVPGATILAVSGETFRDFVEQQGAFVFFVTIWAGAGLIANDRRANALQIYLSKPLSRVEYIAGKLAVLAFFLLLVTWVPGMLLLLLQGLLAGSFSFVRSNLYLFPALTLSAFLQVLLAAFTMLALSSLSKSSRYVGILYAGIVFFTEAMYGVLFLITRGTAVSWVSFTANLEQVVDVIFRRTPRYETPWQVSLLVILGLMVVSASVLERRVRGVEIVT
jgi:ABC-2 type transport system permease protein